MKWYSTDCMADWVASLPDEFNCVEDKEEIRDATSVRLHVQQERIKFLEQRLELAENVIGEMYLMMREEGMM